MEIPWYQNSGGGGWGGERIEKKKRERERKAERQHVKLCDMLASETS